MSADLGIDRSGNTNHWAVNNMTYSDQMLDSPTNNFCTLNPLETISDSITFSEGNLKHSQAAAGAYRTSVATIEMPQSGKWYAEARVDGTVGAGTGGEYHGWSLTGTENYITSGFGNTGNTVGILDSQGTDTTMRINGSDAGGSGQDTDAGAAAAGDIIQWAFDSDSGKCWLGKNNTWYGNSSGPADTTDTPNPSTGAYPLDTFTAAQIQGGVIMFLGMSDQSNTNGWVANFGQDSSFAGETTAQGNQDGNDIGDFYYTPPTDFLALCTSNLPEPAVVPSEHFNTVLYTGNDSDNHTITGVGFQPDFLWIKNRGTTDIHEIVDSVRGQFSGGNGLGRLRSNDTTAEIDSTIEGFTSDGFTLDGDNTGYNGNSANYVAWNWKANGSGSSNTAGDINSTVSVNTDAGFSIVSYTGNGSNGQTVGHGLSKAPELIIVKTRETAFTWGVGNDSIGWSKYLNLDSTAAEQTGGGTFNSAAPTSTLFTVADNYSVNGEGHIAYCFHSVDGYSRFGTYIGNANVDGTFVYTGFRPRFLITKRVTPVESWVILDSARDTIQPFGTRLKANTEHAEGGGYDTDFNANGFKIRNTDGGMASSGYTYLYIAFAETPFKYSNAR
jgi:hypothetical protein